MKNIGRVLLGSRNFLVAATFVAILTVVPVPVVHLQSQTGEANRSRDKVLEIGDDFHAPVKVTLVKSQARVIRPGEPFSDGEDWFKGLTISVRNDSGKPITYISLRIRFPRPKGQENELDFVEPLNYGVSPMPDAAGQVPFNPAKTVLPGETAELKLADEDYNDIKMLLKDSKYPSSINKIKVSIMMLGFNDGAVWISGKMYTPDKNNPGRLIPLEKKSEIDSIKREKQHRFGHLSQIPSRQLYQTRHPRCQYGRRDYMWGRSTINPPVGLYWPLLCYGRDRRRQHIR